MRRKEYVRTATGVDRAQAGRRHKREKVQKEEGSDGRRYIPNKVQTKKGTYGRRYRRKKVQEGVDYCVHIGFFWFPWFSSFWVGFF